MTEQLNLYDPLHNLYGHTAFPSRDFSVNEWDAWTFGVVVGWSDVELPDVRRRHKWNDARVALLKQLNADFRTQCGFAPRPNETAEPA